VSDVPANLDNAAWAAAAADVEGLQSSERCMIASDAPSTSISEALHAEGIACRLSNPSGMGVLLT